MLQTFDTMGTCDLFDQGTLPYNLDERFSLVSFLVEVSDIPGCKRLRQWDVNGMLPNGQ